MLLRQAQDDVQSILKCNHGELVEPSFKMFKPQTRGRIIFSIFSDNVEPLFFREDFSNMGDRDLERTGEIRYPLPHLGGGSEEEFIILTSGKGKLKKIF